MVVGGATAAILLIVIAASVAIWAGDGSGRGASQHAIVAEPAGSAPTVAVAGTSVKISWPPNDILPQVQAPRYRVTRYNEDGTPSAPPLGTCAGDIAGLSCVDAEVPDGTFRYTVRAVRGATWAGEESARSAPARVSTVSIAFPVNGATYGIASYGVGCGIADVCGSVLVRPRALLNRVQVSVRRGDAYWNPTWHRFMGGGERLMDATFARDEPKPSPSRTQQRSTQGRQVSPWRRWSPSPSPSRRPSSNQTTVTWSMAFPTVNFDVAGEYTIHVVTTDDRGHTGDGSSTFRLMPRAPNAPAFSSKPSALSNGQTATFAFAGRDSGTGYECAVDKGGFSACASPYTTPRLTSGQHTVRVRAVDAAGNASPEIGYTWQVDNTPPTALDVQTTNGINLAGMLGNGDTITLTYSEPVSTRSVLPGWDGTKPAAITIRAVPGFAGGPDTLFFYDAANARPVRALGMLTLGQTGYVIGQNIVIPATLTGRDAVYVVTLGPPSDGAHLGRVNTPAGMTWCPGGGTDAAGNSVSNSSTGVVERGGVDVDF